VLTALRAAAIGRRLAINELHRQPAPRVLRAKPGVVLSHTRARILRDARVEREIGAANDVDVPERRRCCGGLGFWLSGTARQSPSAYNNVSLYMIRRPMKITPNHAISDTIATTFALVGASPSAGRPATFFSMPVT